jgi:regulatory protein
MNYLARREHSQVELFRKLKQNNFADAAIQQTLDQLMVEGLLSNRRFIENYIHYRREKGYGPLRIHAELSSRGLDEEFIEEHIQMSDNLWFDAARKLWQKRFKGLVPRDFKARARQMRFLHYRGFTQDQIEKIFQNT